MGEFRLTEQQGVSGRKLGEDAVQETGAGQVADDKYVAKGADLRTFSQADLDAIARELNHRPRKAHGDRTPAEVYAEPLNSGDALTA